MSTLGTRCASCLELRCQLEKMSFFSPDLTRKMLELKEKSSNNNLGVSLRGAGTAAELAKW